MPRLFSSRASVRGMRAALVAALALVGLTCRESSPVGPGLPSRAGLSIAPRFEVVAGGPVIELATARVRVFRVQEASRTLVKDTTAAFEAGSAALSMSINVQVMGGEDDFELHITAMDAAGNVIYSAIQMVTVLAGMAPETPTDIVMNYVAADTAVATLSVQPRDSVITAQESFTFRVVGRKSDGSLIATRVGWTSGDLTKLQINQGTGVATALTQMSNVMVIATTGRGKADTTFVSATQPVAAVIVSPGTASLFVGGTQQLSAQVQAAGGVPLPTRPIHWTSSDPAIATVSTTGLVTAVSLGSAIITASSGGQSASASITITRRAPTIVWATPADITFGALLSAAQLNASAVFNGVPVPGTFAYLPTIGTLLPAGTRPLGVTFTPADQVTYSTATGLVSINVLKAAQTITFNALSDRVFGEPDFAVSATASSALVVTFAASGVCTVSGVTVRLTGSGTCTITASQSGDANRNAAADVVRTFSVTRAPVTIIAASVTGVFGGTVTLTATVSAGGAPLAGKTVTFTLNGVAAGTAVSNAAGSASVANVSLSGINAGTYPGAISPPTGVVASFGGDADFNAAAGAGTLTVGQANQSITFDALPNRRFGDPAFTVAATSSAGLTVTFSGTGSCVVSGNTVTLVSEGDCTITASQAGNGNYLAAPSVARTFAVTRAVLTTTSATGVFGGITTLSATLTSAGAPVAGRTIAFTLNGSAAGSATTDASGVATITGVSLSGINAGTYAGAFAPPSGVNASFAGDATYNAASATGTLLVSKASATLTLGTLTFPYDGTAKPVSVTVTPAGVSGITVLYNGSATAPSAAGSYSVVASLANANYQAADATGTLVIGQASQSISFGALADKLLGDPNFVVTATASSGLAVSFTSTGSCTVSGSTVTLVSEGTCTITASQAGDQNYSAAAAVPQSFNVGPRPVASLEIAPPTAVVETNGTVLFVATPKDANGQPMSGRSIGWSSGNTGIATVVDGVVTGVSVGQTTITASVEGKTATATINVQAPPPQVTSTTLVSAEHDTLFSIGGQRLLVAQSYNGDALVAGSYRWSSTNPGVAVVSSLGLVTSVANGTAQVIVTESGGTADTLEIVVLQRLARIEVSPSLVKLVVGTDTTLTVTGYDAAGTPMSLPAQVRWSKSEYNEVVGIDSITGAISGMDVGNITVMARSGAFEGRALIQVVTLVQRIVVTPPTRTLNAFGQTVQLNAVAYDANDAPLEGIEFDWESQNESVARVTAFSGGSATVTSFSNGVALVRASAQGVRADAAITVAQQLASIVVSPASLTLGAGGVDVLSVQGFDANGRPLAVAADSILWSSSNAALVSVNASGVVTAAPSAVAGSATITATARNTAIQASSIVSVVPTLAGQLSFGGSVLSIGSGDTITVKVLLNRAEASPFTVSLSVADGIAQWQPSTVAFASGQTEASANLVGVRSGTTTVMAYDTRPTGAVNSGSATLSVQSTAVITTIVDNLLAGDRFASRVQLSEPAPAGGTWVSFQYSTPGVLSVDPGPVFVPAGQIAADIVVHGLASGTTTITPVMPGVAAVPSTPVQVHAIGLIVNQPTTPRLLGAGQFGFGGSGSFGGGCEFQCYEEYGYRPALTRAERGPGSAARGAPSGGSTPKTSVRIPTSPGVWADYLSDNSCGGRLIIVDGLMKQDAEQPIMLPDFCLSVATAPQQPLSIQMTSSNSGIALVEEALTLVNAAVGFGVNAKSPGSATLTASVQGWPSVTIPVIVTTPTLSAYGYSDDYNEDHVVLRGNGEIYVDIAVGDSLKQEHPLVNSATVRLSPSNPAVFRVLDTMIVIAAGQSYNAEYFRVEPVGAGIAWLRVRSDGYVSDSIMVEVPSRTLVVERNTMLGAGQQGYIELRSAMNEASPVAVTIASLGDTVSAAIDGSVTLSAGNSTTTVSVRGFATGVTSFLVTAAGFDPETVTVTVTTPALLLSLEGPFVLGIAGSGNASVAFGDSTGQEHALIGAVNVTLASENPNIATSDASVNVSAGESRAFFNLNLANVGSTRLFAQASGYGADTATLVVTSAKFSIQQTPLIRVAERPYTWSQPYFSIPSTFQGSDSVVVVNVIQKHPEFVGLQETRFVGRYLDVWKTFNLAGLSAGTDTIIVVDSAGRILPDTMFVTVLPTSFNIDVGSEVAVEAGQTTYEFTSSIVFESYNSTIGKPVVMVASTSDSSVAYPESNSFQSINDQYFNPRFTIVGPGTVELIVADSTGQIAPDTVRLTVHRARLITYTTYLPLGTRQTAPDGGNVYMPIQSEAATTVFLSSSDPSVASVPGSIVIPPGVAYGEFAVTSHDTIGVVRIKMQVDGLDPAYMDVDVRRPQLYVSLSTDEIAGSQQNVSVVATDFMGNARNVTENVTVALATSDPSVAGTDSVQITIPAGQSYGEATMFYRAPGRTIFSARDSRYPALIGYKPFVDTIVVMAPQLNLTFNSPRYLAPAQAEQVRVDIYTAIGDSIVVTAVSSDATIASVPSTFVIRASEGGNMGFTTVTAHSLGDAVVTFSAPGYRSVSYLLKVQPGQVSFETSPNFLMGSSTTTRLVTANPYYQQQTAMTEATAFTLNGGGKIKFFEAGTTNEITSITVAAGQYLSASFRVEPVSQGNAVITVANPNFATLTLNGEVWVGGTILGP